MLLSKIVIEIRESIRNRNQAIERKNCTDSCNAFLFNLQRIQFSATMARFVSR